MKPSTSPSRAFHRPFLAALLALTAAPAPAQLPEGASVQLSRSPAAVDTLTLSDPGNHCWTIQRSRDLGSWTALEACKVHNGQLNLTFPGADAGGAVFYRAFYDPAQQSLQSTAATALRLPAQPFNYAAPELPPAFAAQPILGQDNTPPDNRTTDAGAALGRVLFHDKRLSRNFTVSCASCHQQAHGFSDPRPFSVGFAGGLTGRNSMGLAHARWYQRRAFFWDERAATLEIQVLEPIVNQTEMGMTLPEAVARVQAEPFYGTLFTAAFGSPAVTTDRMARALAQFVRSIVSVRTKYDAGVPVNFANFTAQEQLGRRIFLGQVGNATCATCHGTDNFVPGPTINNNGLENPYVDKGLGAITGRPQDEGLFKVPSLRNIALTAPYMHDGRFTTLEQVVDFYNAGVVNHPNLSPPLRNPPGQPPGPRRLNLTPDQKAALVAFLHTLTDPDLATDPRWSDPFNYGR